MIFIIFVFVEKKGKRTILVCAFLEVKISGIYSEASDLGFSAFLSAFGGRPRPRFSPSAVFFIGFFVTKNDLCNFSDDLSELNGKLRI